MTKSPGFTLLELMMSMSLGVALITGLITVYLSVLNIYALQQDWIEVQQNGRMIVMILRNSLTQNQCKSLQVRGFDQQHRPSFVRSQSIVGDGLIIKRCINTAYYIAKTNRITKNKFPVYALFAKRENKQRQELLENINNLKILYGVKCADNMVCQLLNIKQIKTWGVVKLIYFQFNLVSLDNQLNKKWRLAIAL